MKKKLISIISLTLAAAIGLSACSSGSAGGTGTAAGKDTAGKTAASEHADSQWDNSVAMILPGLITDEAFNQFTYEGMVKAKDENQSIGSLSGGNIQKAIVAREFKAPSDLLVLNQPTRGVDVGAISFIHSKILEMRSHNKAILLSSADLNELISLSDRILVMHKGKVVGALSNTPKVTEQELGLYMLGLKKQEGLG